MTVLMLLLGAFGGLLPLIAGVVLLVLGISNKNKAMAIAGGVILGIALIPLIIIAILAVITFGIFAQI